MKSDLVVTVEEEQGYSEDAEETAMGELQKLESHKT
jgi:hypothetical protein